MYRPLEALATLVSTRSICVSQATVDQARELHLVPLRKLVAISNGIDPTEFLGTGTSALRRELGIPEDTLIIGNTARLRPQKDNQTLVRAMAHLESILPETRCVLLLAGDGPDQPMLEDIVRSMDLRGKVLFLGFRSDIPEFLSAIDIFVSPSLWEGLSISLMEAMAAAKPIVTTSIPPNAKSPEQLAAAIARFAQDRALSQRCASAARQRVLEHYTIDRMFMETWDLYVDLLGQKRPGAVASSPL
jgi:glycosyltransferase involved in cell wall biosynthesis